jgi:hypothetical protein
MIDPTAWATVALTFVGAQVAQKAANGAIQTIWDRFYARFLATHDKPPTAVALRVLRHFSPFAAPSIP